jgi:VanZ family protein
MARRPRTPSDGPTQEARVASVEQTLQIRSYQPLRLGLAMAWTALILVLCLTPSEWFPRPESHGPRLINIPHFDKIIHATLFAVFGLLWTWAIVSPRRWAGVLIAGLLLALGTEVLQAIPFIHRDPDLFDGLADGVGTFLGVGLAWLGDILFRPNSQR